MKLTAEEARWMVCDDHDDFEAIEENITDTSRWSIHYEGIFKHTPTGKYYSVDWSVGATEQQDERAFEYDTEVELTEVEQVEVTVTKWVTKKSE